MGLVLAVGIERQKHTPSKPFKPFTDVERQGVRGLSKPFKRPFTVN
jgi:hypothetical protein